MTPRAHPVVARARLVVGPTENHADEWSHGTRARSRGARNEGGGKSRRGRGIELALVVATALLWWVAACGDSSHVFEGRLYIAERACLGTTASVDVVEGDRARECGPTCLVQPLQDGGRAVYTASKCAPYPYGFDASGSDPECPNALAALSRDDTCLLDGGSTNPP